MVGIVEVGEVEGVIIIELIRRKAIKGIVRSIIRTTIILLVASKLRRLLSFITRIRAVKKGEIVIRIIIPLPSIL